MSAARAGSDAKEVAKEAAKDTLKDATAATRKK
jgi:hypothetical protein